MRLDDYRSSDNVGDQRGQRFGGSGGGGLGLIMNLVASRFGIGGIIVVAIGAMLLGINPFGGGSGVGPGVKSSTEVSQTAAQKACAVDAASTFSCRVLASTEDTWAKIFAERGQKYAPAGFIFYGGTGQSGCGAAQSAMGPFYCPTDNRVYLDTSFYNELQQRFGAAGDFAQAYVIAHEIGHHLQYLSGTLDKASAAQARASSAEGNAIQVKVELQADCYAGVWGGRNRDRLEPGDIEEGLRAASAIGDDTLQKASQGRVVPESFTHGSSEQRMAWLKRGLETADPAACDTFAG
jgi:predicted metalloprotease